MDFLAGRLKLSRRGAKSLLDMRVVFVNGQRIWMARHHLAAGDQISVAVPASTRTESAALRTLHRDPHYLVLDKPAGILATGPDSLETRARSELHLPFCRAAHRLDRDTTGCLLLALSAEAFEAAVTLFRERGITKYYRAIVHGTVERPGNVRNPVDGLPAVTLYSPIRANPVATHLDIEIRTGRTHQIRRHLAEIHHPVAGDKQYATRVEADTRVMQIPRQMLHAHRLEFVHPVSHARIAVTAPIPRDFREALQLLRLGG